MNKLGNRVASDSMLVSVAYKSNIAPRSNVISRKAPIIRKQQFGTQTNVSVLPIPFTNQAKNPALVEFQENRNKEKRDLSHLNDKFAQYLERVRFLEVHNKKLEMELQSLQTKIGIGAQKIREMYNIEIESAQNIVAEMRQDRDVADKRLNEANTSLGKNRSDALDAIKQHENNLAKINQLNYQIRDNEIEMNLLRRRLDDLNDEILKWKNEAKRLIGEIQKVTQQLDYETLKRIQVESEKQQVLEELNFLSANHSRELEAFRQQLLADNGLDMSQFFRSELASAINEIRSEYEESSAAQQAELERCFRCRQEELMSKANHKKETAAAEQTIIREQMANLRSTISNQRGENASLRANNAELEARIKELDEQIADEINYGNKSIKDRDYQIQKLNTNQIKLQSDYDELLNNRQTLVDEIRTYERLLEGDSNQNGLKQVVQSIETRLNNPKITLNSFTIPLIDSMKESVSLHY